MADLSGFSAGRAELPPDDGMERGLRTHNCNSDWILPGKDILSHLTCMVSVDGTETGRGLVAGKPCQYAKPPSIRISPPENPVPRKAFGTAEKTGRMRNVQTFFMAMTQASARNVSQPSSL